MNLRPCPLLSTPTTCLFRRVMLRRTQVLKGLPAESDSGKPPALNLLLRITFDTVGFSNRPSLLECPLSYHPIVWPGRNYPIVICNKVLMAQVIPSLLLTHRKILGERETCVVFSGSTVLECWTAGRISNSFLRSLCTQ